MVRVDPGRPRVAGPGERADDPLAVQRGAQPLVGHVPLDDVGDRSVQHDLERLVVVGEELLERGAVGRVADPGVAERAAPQAFADPVEQRVVARRSRRRRAATARATDSAVRASSCHSVSDVPSANGVHCTGSTGKVR